MAICTTEKRYLPIDLPLIAGYYAAIILQKVNTNIFCIAQEYAWHPILEVG